jgi:prevent-host-death family protein
MTSSEGAMPKVAASEFKARCLELMDRVAERRESYVITKRGKPVAKLGPVDKADDEPLFGRLRGLFDVVGDITGPVVPPEQWDAVRLGRRPRRPRKRR